MSFAGQIGLYPTVFTYMTFFIYVLPPYVRTQRLDAGVSHKLCIYVKSLYAEIAVELYLL